MSRLSIAIFRWKNAQHLLTYFAGCDRLVTDPACAKRRRSSPGRTERAFGRGGRCSGTGVPNAFTRGDAESVVPGHSSAERLARPSCRSHPLSPRTPRACCSRALSPRTGRARAMSWKREDPRMGYGAILGSYKREVPTARLVPQGD